MASKVFTSRDDETLVRSIQQHGLLAPKGDPKWKVLRIALALSLRLPEAPAETFDDYPKDGGEYALPQLCGDGQEEDYTDAFRALLSVYHDTDLFSTTDDQFVRLLQRHIRRGLHEIDRSWAIGHDFHELLYQELFSKRQQEADHPIEDLTQKLLTSLRQFNIRAEIKRMVDGPRLQSYEAILADAGQLRLLQKRTEELAFDLACGPVSISIGQEPRQADILIPKPRNTWKTVTWESVQAAIPDDKNMRLGIVLGVNTLGIPIPLDLADAPHLLVGGTTGSGKSICLHALLCSLLSRHKSNSLRLCLIDPKRTELSEYEGLPHLHGEAPVQDVSLAASTLDKIAKEMEQRETQLVQRGFKQLMEWRASSDDAPPYLVVVVEELADLLLQHPEAESPLIRLAQKGRASGIHLVLATQRPDSATFSGLLRSNVPSRVALTVQKASESRIIIDETGAELLLGRGDMLLKFFGNFPCRMHGTLLTSTDIRSIVATAKHHEGK
ncbi:MAG: DndE family protein [Zoogloeaceae bacterium]|jgi:S-DNA-T family DNA segregation ATPase FtsK/SpoIIIE|nr:DndE family protein [Zoogloeaceae bacterium]